MGNWVAAIFGGRTENRSGSLLSSNGSNLIDLADNKGRATTRWDHRNIGWNGTYHSAARVDAPQSMTPEEAAAVMAFSSSAVADSRTAAKAFKALAEVEKADAERVTAFNDYRAVAVASAGKQLDSQAKFVLALDKERGAQVARLATVEHQVAQTNGTLVGLDRWQRFSREQFR